MLKFIQFFSIVYKGKKNNTLIAFYLKTMHSNYSKLYIVIIQNYS